MDTRPLDILEESVQIPQKGTPLDGVLAYPFVGFPNRAALVVGPHPLMGGRLENNVVRYVGRGLAEHGFATLRFRFGGAGASPEVMQRFWQTGNAPDDPQRGEDAAAAYAWIAALCGGPIILVGYSFGASLLARLLNERVRGVVLIGATLAQHEYSSLATSTMPKLLIAADNDFATPLGTTESWLAAAAEPKRLVIVPSAEHFYRGQEPRIVEEIMRWLTI
jgi:alpha/beta superfamily hydrolase